MVEPDHRLEGTTLVPLTLDSPVSAIDSRLAARRLGREKKGPPAADALRDGLGIATVRDLLHHYPRGYLEMAFFNQPWTASQYREGMEVAVSGTIAAYGRRLQAQQQEVEVLRDGTDTVHTRRITPVHPATEGVSARTIRELIWRALERLPDIGDPLP